MSANAQHPDLPLPSYFSQMAGVYCRQTGNSTRNILEEIIIEHVQTSANALGPDSVVHDTAAGPGIGAAAILTTLPKDQLPREVLVTDNTPRMIETAEESLKGSPFTNAKCQVLDSQDLSELPDEYFTHSINNFSIFTFTQPAKGVSESWRTLKKGGLAIVTCWSRFAPAHIVHAAQKAIRPDLPPLPTPGAQFFEDGVLQRVVEEGGFAKENVTVHNRDFLVSSEENLAGLKAMMSGPLMKRAREGFTEEEEAKWAGAIERAVSEEVSNFGGIKFGIFELLATK